MEFDYETLVAAKVQIDVIKTLYRMTEKDMLDKLTFYDILGEMLEYDNGEQG